MFNRKPAALLVLGGLLAAACGSGVGTPTTDHALQTGDTQSSNASTTVSIDPDEGLRVIVRPGPDGRMPSDVEIGCQNGPTFPASALDEIHPLSEVGRPDIEEAISGFLGSEEGVYWPQEDWQILHQRDDRILLMHSGEPEPSFSFMSVEQHDGEWKWSGASGGSPCPLHSSLPERLNSVSWRVDPAAGPVTAESTTLTLLVTERDCASGQAMGDRLLGPEIVITDTAVLIAFAAERRPGLSQTCPSNPEEAVVVTLPEPLGDRMLTDGLAVAGNLEDYLD